MRKIRNKDCKNTIQMSEESLGKELGEQKRNAIREEKIRQLLWETSPELKELRQKMLVADITRDQIMQVAEKQALLDLKREEEKSLVEAAAREKREFEEEQKRIEEEEFRAKFKYHKDLDELREFKMAKKEADIEQIQREKTLIDEIKRQIQEEAEEEEKRKQEAKKELHRQALELQKVREQMKQREKMKDKAQNLKADEYRKAQELRAKEMEEKKHLELERRLRLQEDLLSCLEKMYKEKEKEEQLWIDLAIEEKDIAAKKRTEEEESKRKKLRDELQRLYDIQMHVRKQKAELEKKEEELLRQGLLAQLYEEGKLELMSQQKRRLKQVEHRRLVQKLIEENRKKKSMEKLREMADFKYQQELESERLKMVEEERMRYLRDYATELLGYLPKGVFKDEREIEHLGEEFKKFYSRQKCSS
ncbi:meiosis-specific nuclear structural protein 1-like [Uloborus diversus]|uniref:meiosis-specific nuclear structural protein 1-like n=1 Tax=Uloborus diversus TaxID=327109 RepID=UPI002409DE79|nr:meiosis-specific nuclear structural protein 1-like [Uloborus diversus]